MSLFFTKEHEWAKVEDNIVTMGISDHAQQALGDITFVELPSVGDDVQQGSQLATIESVKAASDVYAPVSGKVVKVNNALDTSPEIVNQSAYENGWFCKIEIEDTVQLDNLMDEKEYQEYLTTL